MTKPNDTLLSIIIVSYNTADLTAQTLSSIKLSLEKSELLNSTEVFIVDNNSSDNSIKKIKSFQKKFKHFKLIENKDNKGFSRANNQAAKLAKGEYLLLLNSDTIVQRKALENLIKGAKKHNLGISASRLLNQDHTVQPQGGNLPSLVTLFNHMFFLDDLPFIGKFFPSTQNTGMNYKNHRKICKGGQIQVTKTGWVGGTAMLISHKLWDKVGPLDEKIFMYGEDIELCLRAKISGTKIGIVTSSLIVHLGSASSSSKNALLGELKGYNYIWKKHKPTWQYPFLKIILMAGVILRIVLFGMILRKPKGKVYLEALKVI